MAFSYNPITFGAITFPTITFGVITNHSAVELLHLLGVFTLIAITFGVYCLADLVPNVRHKKYFCTKYNSKVILILTFGNTILPP